MMAGKPCSTCGLMAVEPNAVAITDEKKWLTAPSPCPECMEESKRHFSELGRRMAKKVEDAVWSAFSDCAIGSGDGGPN